MVLPWLKTNLLNGVLVCSCALHASLAWHPCLLYMLACLMCLHAVCTWHANVLDMLHKMACFIKWCA